MLRVLELSLLLPLLYIPGALTLRMNAGGESAADPLAAVRYLTEAVMRSLAIMGVAGFAIYVSGFPTRITALTVAALVIVLGALRIRHLSAPFNDATVRTLMQALVILQLLLLCAVSLIRAYSGGLWCCDWSEHFARARFFLERPPTNIDFGGYSLSARPPLANLIIAFMMAVAGPDYLTFQLANVLVAGLLLLPLYLIAASVTGERPKASLGLGLAAILLANPMFMQNATFPWTKMQTSVFVLYGVSLFAGTPGSAISYRSGFFWLGVATLCHYSAVPWVISAAIFFFLAPARKIDKQRSTGRMLALIEGPCIAFALLIPWLAWSSYELGFSTTFFSNTAVTDSAKMSLFDNLRKMLANVACTLVPLHLWTTDVPHLYDTPLLRSVREYAFHLYQMNLPLALGVTNLVVVLAELRSRLTQQRSYALAIALVSLVSCGIMVHGALGVFGLAQICLQPLVFIGLAVVVSRYPSLSPRLRTIVAAGWLLDFLIGVALHLAFEYATVENSDLGLKRIQDLVFLGDLSVYGAALRLTALGTVTLLLSREVLLERKLTGLNRPVH